MAKEETKIEQLHHKLEEARDKVVALEKKFEGKVGEHPIQSLAITFGVGVACGALLCAMAGRGCNK
jgi:ElaB/YqjD/DUF883 family membrane-anchored ribosome-binding protein|tara:strand:- start:410 stop:607 length:198 start_codon:yes stop_codon:yes gene_type:complete